MNKYLNKLALIGSVMLTPAAWAGERTITFAVDNMTCASCPHIVKSSMTAVRRGKGGRVIPSQVRDRDVR